MKKLVMLLMIASLVCVASADIRYHGSGSWDMLEGVGQTEGWQSATPPDSASDVRANWANNTVTLNHETTVNRFQLGVDESGGFHIQDGGVLNANGSNKVGNNNNCTGTLKIDAGGTVNANGGWMMIAGNSLVTGIADVSGTLNVEGHLWMATGAGSTATLDINGGTVTVGDNIGLGTVNAADPSGGIATINLNAGTLNLDHWSYPGSIQAGSVIDIEAGVIIINGDKRSNAEDYVTAGKITAYDGNGTVHYDTTTNPGKTTIWAVDDSSVPGNGDVNLDSFVDGTDLLLFVAEWLDPDPDPNADFTRDGNVDMADYQIFAKNWLHNEYRRTLTGKIMCGYQGWFNTPTDGAGRGWTHWGGSTFEPGVCTVDMWPDMSEYAPGDKYDTVFLNSDGSTAQVFSSYDEKTVLKHFEWMEQYGIDGVFLQRFASETTPGSSARNHRDQVMLHCRKGGNQYKRAWAMMYDLSGTHTGPVLKQKVIDDWKHLVDTYQLTQDPTDIAYLHHNGKPVVAIWGLGFERAYEGQDTVDIIDFLKNDPTYGGCTIMIGVDKVWRTLKDTDSLFGQIVQMADIISPWAVGRYGSIYESELNNFTTNYTIPDQNWCNANNKDYLPGAFPGFSWQNLKGEKWDHIPRLGGQFLWRQFYKAINDAGCTMIYQAMFDEVDEGTAIFKCTSTPPVADSTTGTSTPFLPTGNIDFAPYPFSLTDYPYNAPDASLPSDHYLWLVGEGTKMLNGEIPLNETMPTR